MEGLSIQHPLTAIVIVVVCFVAIVRILSKPLYSGRRSLLRITNIVMFWIFAVAEWPTLPGSGRQ